MASVNEESLLREIYARSAGLTARFPQVLVGPGSDCAAVAAGTGPVILKVDQLVEGRHCLPRPRTTPDQMARKAVARVVSDIAAAGGVPIAGLCAAALPRGDAGASALFEAVKRWAEHFGMPLVGGDIASHDGPGAILSVTGVGAAHPVRGVVTRSGARPGDFVYVTGALGGSFERATGLGRHLTFEPRLREAAWLCDTLGAGLRAMMDLSDGLGRDAGRMARASGVRIELEAKAIPLHEGVSGWESAAGDGEDYELLVVVDGAAAALPHCCPVTRTPLTRIGCVREAEGRPTAEMVVGGRRIDVSELGYAHE